MFSWLKAILALLGVVSKGEDIVKTSQENARREQDQRQGEQNANASSTASALAAVVNADRASRDPAVDKRVRDQFERP